MGGVDKVKPIFEKYESEYQVEYIIETMQNAALEFVNDIVKIFEEDISLLYYQDYYITLPIMGYINSSKRIDKEPLSAIEFEDDIRTGKSRKMIDDMQEDLNAKNQKTMDKLLINGNLQYNPVVDLSERNKIVRLVYYLLFDKDTIKRRIKEVLKNIKKKL